MTRDRIIDAARLILETEGLDGLTIRKVATRCGLSPMAIYRHFADKDALINALTADGFVAWEARVRAITEADPMAWLRALTDAFLDFALAEPHRFDAAFFLPASQARQYPDDFVAGRSPAVALIMVRIDEARALGRLDATSSLDITLSLTATAQGLVSMHRARRFSSDAQFADLFRATMARGLAAFTLKA
ncbi:TetR/AcrR family transcriptional regulator [Asticcacaulis solisilvae]|uniref:TetR/AcrR family transcriptional regulator n=1 Tax=Asticcacaulis solisilvae TaxID=1217274 RepID=UPI003FD85F7D